MLHLTRSLALAAAVTLVLGACDKRCAAPKPSCYSGTIVGGSCVDGLLIDVDPAFGIGAPALQARSEYKFQATGDTLIGQHVIAVVNTGELGDLRGVKHLYFTYEDDPNRQWNGLMCNRFDGVKSRIPHLVLHNVSKTNCEESTAATHP